jgi:hypothetical protein
MTMQWDQRTREGFRPPNLSVRTVLNQLDSIKKNLWICRQMLQRIMVIQIGRIWICRQTFCELTRSSWIDVILNCCRCNKAIYVVYLFTICWRKSVICYTVCRSINFYLSDEGLENGRRIRRKKIVIEDGKNSGNGNSSLLYVIYDICWISSSYVSDE